MWKVLEGSEEVHTYVGEYGEYEIIIESSRDLLYILVHSKEF